MQSKIPRNSLKTKKSGTRKVTHFFEATGGRKAAAAGATPAATMKNCPMRTLRQRINVQLVGRDNRHVLLAVLPLERHRIRISVALERRGPQLLARLRIERAESMIGSRADENQPARRGDRTRAAAIPGVLLAFRQSLGDAERGLPGDLAGVAVHRGQPSPRRFLAGPVADDFAAGVLARRAESGVGSGALNARAIVLLRGAFRAAPVIPAVLFLLDPAHQRHVVRLH